MARVDPKWNCASPGCGAPNQTAFRTHTMDPSGGHPPVHPPNGAAPAEDEAAAAALTVSAATARGSPSEAEGEGSQPGDGPRQTATVRVSLDTLSEWRQLLQKTRHGQKTVSSGPQAVPGKQLSVTTNTVQTRYLSKPRRSSGAATRARPSNAQKQPIG